MITCHLRSKAFVTGDQQESLILALSQSHRKGSWISYWIISRQWSEKSLIEQVTLSGQVQLLRVILIFFPHCFCSWRSEDEAGNNQVTWRHWHGHLESSVSRDTDLWVGSYSKNPKQLIKLSNACMLSLGLHRNSFPLLNPQSAHNLQLII